MFSFRNSRLWKSLAAALIFLVSFQAHARWDEKFTVRKKITLDTTSTGTAIAEPIGGATLLVRLHDGNFDFAAAKEDGSDIRFIAADDKTPLPFHIEKYDSLLHEALVWVKLPEVAANGKTELWLYYGNPGAERAGDPKTSYDGDTALVYHFAESNAAPSDATSLANNAQTVGTTVGALIGNGTRLGLPTPVTLPASPSLAWANGAAFTWSAWVKLTTLEPNAAIFTRREGGSSFIIGADNGTPFVAVGGQRAAAGAPLTTGTWHHLAVVADSGRIALYVNGEAAGNISGAIPALSSPALLGADPASGAVSAKGELDELQISRVARPAGFIKFAAISQAGEKAAKLIVYSEEEKAAGGDIFGDGYFGIILKNLTVDGWVVIVLLAIMGTVTLFVVLAKWRYLRRIGLGNRLFLSQWKALSDDLGALEDDKTAFGKSIEGSARKALARSPLFTLFRIGMEEIAHRMKLRAGQPKSLTSRGIQAIRASLDGGLVVEQERLNSGIVLLTIAISGGPFLGLLGTVVGVMITFAAVAAAGDVNVNAIAPGIAAALLATVAGLAVAIPALFAYNYLLTRIKAATRDLNVFVESFVTKMAEQYRGGPAD